MRITHGKVLFLRSPFLHRFSFSNGTETDSRTGNRYSNHQTRRKEEKEQKSSQQNRLISVSVRYDAIFKHLNPRYVFLSAADFSTVSFLYVNAGLTKQTLSLKCVFFFPAIYFGGIRTAFA